MSTILGVILAGGRGKRLGGTVKANLKVGGIRLIDRVSHALEHQCAQIIISSGNLVPETLTSQYHAPIVPDSGPQDSGPVAGLASAVAWARDNFSDGDLILTAAADTPFFPTDFVERALPLLGDDKSCVMGAEGEQRFPTNALWRISALSKLPELAHQGALPNGLKSIVGSDATALVCYDALDPEGCFFNINTPENIITAERLVG